MRSSTFLIAVQALLVGSGIAVPTDMGADKLARMFHEHHHQPEGVLAREAQAVAGPGSGSDNGGLVPEIAAPVPLQPPGGGGDGNAVAAGKREAQAVGAGPVGGGSGQAPELPGALSNPPQQRPPGVGAGSSSSSGKRAEAAGVVAREAQAVGASESPGGGLAPNLPGAIPVTPQQPPGVGAGISSGKRDQAEALARREPKPQATGPQGPLVRPPPPPPQTMGAIATAVRREPQQSQAIAIGAPVVGREAAPQATAPQGPNVRPPPPPPQTMGGGIATGVRREAHAGPSVVVVGREAEPQVTVPQAPVTMPQAPPVTMPAPPVQTMGSGIATAVRREAQAGPSVVVVGREAEPQLIGSPVAQVPGLLPVEGREAEPQVIGTPAPLLPTGFVTAVRREAQAGPSVVVVGREAEPQLIGTPGQVPGFLPVEGREAEPQVIGTPAPLLPTGLVTVLGREAQAGPSVVVVGREAEPQITVGPVLDSQPRQQARQLSTVVVGFIPREAQAAAAPLITAGPVINRELQQQARQLTAAPLPGADPSPGVGIVGREAQAGPIGGAGGVAPPEAGPSVGIVGREAQQSQGIATGGPIVLRVPTGAAARDVPLIIPGPVLDGQLQDRQLTAVPELPQPTVIN